MALEHQLVQLGPAPRRAAMTEAQAAALRAWAEEEAAAGRVGVMRKMPGWGTGGVGRLVSCRLTHVCVAVGSSLIDDVCARVCACVIVHACMHASLCVCVMDARRQCCWPGRRRTWLQGRVGALDELFGVWCPIGSSVCAWVAVKMHRSWFAGGVCVHACLCVLVRTAWCVCVCLCAGKISYKVSLPSKACCKPPASWLLVPSSSALGSENPCNLQAGVPRPALLEPVLTIGAAKGPGREAGARVDGPRLSGLKCRCAPKKATAAACPLLVRA